MSVLKRLDAFVGDWEFHASVGGRVVGRGRTTFDWLDGGAFLVQHASAEPPLPDTPPGWVTNSPFPVTTIMGLDDSAEKFAMLYADGRGVRRIYEMTVTDGGWTIWRQAPGFFQRFTATFSDDGATISGCWEGSRDGSDWQLDFEQVYVKVHPDNRL
jgi:hypothetical protein